MTKSEIKAVVITAVVFIAIVGIMLVANESAYNAPAACLNATLCK